MGPLQGVRVIEMVGLAPVPFCGMILADLGAELIRVDRLGGGYAAPPGPTDRGKHSVAVDVKNPSGHRLVRELASGADVFIAGYRPGVAERLGIGPADLCTVNPGLIYGRLTDWGQHGPLATRVGNGINYIALSGVLELIGCAGERPVPPTNIVGDFARGGMLLAMGVMAALYERGQSGIGQVIDAAMVDGSSLLLACLHGLHHDGIWNEQRGTNLLDGGAPFYDTFETADGRYVAVGAVEPEFFANLVAVLGIDHDSYDFELNPQSWPQWRKALAVRQPAAAPRFSRTPAGTPRPLNAGTPNPASALSRWDIPRGILNEAIDAGAVA